MSDYNEQPFLCPECGGKDEDENLQQCVSPVFNPDDPVTSIMQWNTCNQCHMRIPAHIAERWNGLTIEQAKQEWQDVYRPKWKRSS